jgi:hypothetical protein
MNNYYRIHVTDEGQIIGHNQSHIEDKNPFADSAHPYYAVDNVYRGTSEWFNIETKSIVPKSPNPSTINKTEGTVGVADDIVISNIPTNSWVRRDNKMLTQELVTDGVYEITFFEAGTYTFEVIPEDFKILNKTFTVEISGAT